MCCVSCPKPSRGRLSKSFCIRGTVQRPLPGPKPSRIRSRDICLNTTSSGSRTHVSPVLVICLLVKGRWPGHHLSVIVKPPLALSWHFFFDPVQFFQAYPEANCRCDLSNVKIQVLVYTLAVLWRGQVKTSGGSPKILISVRTQVERVISFRLAPSKAQEFQASAPAGPGSR